MVRIFSKKDRFLQADHCGYVKSALRPNKQHGITANAVVLLMHATPKLA